MEGGCLQSLFCGAAIPMAWSTGRAAIFPDSALSQSSPQSCSVLRVKAAAERQDSAAVHKENKAPVSEQAARGVWDLAGNLPLAS